MRFEVLNGTFSYDASRTILKDISFGLSDGDTLAILGANGAGKTTLLKNITGLLRWGGGQSRIDGKSLAEMPYKDIWRAIGYVPQVKEYSDFTVLEMVTFGRSVHIGTFGQPSKKDEQKALDVLERLGILHMKERKCSTLSGGEYQLVQIARALTTEPKIMILDEPETGLDFRNQLIVLKLIKQLSEDGLICIFNTHYPEHALTYSNKTLLVKKDGTGIFGVTDDVITEANINEVFNVKSRIVENVVEDRKVKSIICYDL